MKTWIPMLALAGTMVVSGQAQAIEAVASGGSRRSANLESKLAAKLAALAAIVEALAKELKKVENCSISGKYYDVANNSCETSTLGTTVQTNENRLALVEATLAAAAACNANNEDFNWSTKLCESSGNGNVPELSYYTPLGGWPASTGAKNIGKHHVCVVGRTVFRNDAQRTTGNCNVYASGAKDADGKQTWYTQNGRTYWSWMQCYATCMDWD